MGNTCLVCRHADRKSIDTDLINGVPLRNIAKRIGVSHPSVYRHKENHLPKRLFNAEEKAVKRAALKVVNAELEHGISLAEMVNDLYDRARGLLDAAEAAEKYSAAASAIREAGRLVELLARLTGELQQGTTINAQTQVVITSSPEWAAIRTCLLTALQPHPEARVAVAKALEAGDTPNTRSDLPDQPRCRVPPPQSEAAGLLTRSECRGSRRCRE